MEANKNDKPNIKEALYELGPAIGATVAASAFYATASQPVEKSETVTTTLLPKTILEKGVVYKMSDGDTIKYLGLDGTKPVISVWQPNGQEVYTGPVPGLNGNNPVTLQIGSHTWMAFKLVGVSQNTNSPDVQAYIFSNVNYFASIVQHDLILPIALGIVGAGVAASALLHMLRSGSRKKSSALTEKLRKPSA